ncbi:MAG: hypothetical protein ISR65_16260 [Bacteriovoracaceae bacterium]|nr:hypothetical protein [Bacteriovoracaceae bacterium]
MEHNYLNTGLGRIHFGLVIMSLVVIFFGYSYEYSVGKEVVIWGIPVSLIGFGMFLKAKWSVIKQRKFFTIGCHPMSRTNTYLYVIGWILMIAGYFLSFKIQF